MSILWLWSFNINNYQIQALPNSDIESMIIPIGIKVASDLEYTFTQLDVVNSNYKVNLSKDNNGVGRFYLHTRSNALSVDNDDLENVSIYQSIGSVLRVVGLQLGKSKISLYHILGKQVLSRTFIANGIQEITLPKASKRLYIVQIESVSGKLNKNFFLE